MEGCTGPTQAVRAACLGYMLPRPPRSARPAFMRQRSKVGVEGSIRGLFRKVAHPDGMIVAAINPGLGTAQLPHRLGLCLGAGGSTEASTGPFPLEALSAL
ncbi:hypothetical protein BHM03_00053320 [Ensete ventricosum]|nr:hypothetical protein BHM03_00053320 [Ensete ventricosum]